MPGRGTSGTGEPVERIVVLRNRDGLGAVGHPGKDAGGRTVPRDTPSPVWGDRLRHQERYRDSETPSSARRCILSGGNKNRAATLLGLNADDFVEMLMLKSLDAGEAPGP